MSSNSKLTAEQKQARKHYKASFVRHDGGVLVAVDGVTVALHRTGEHSGKFSVSVSGADEQKERRKVGEFYALERWYYDNTLPIRLESVEQVQAMGYRDDAEYLAARAQDLAYVIAEA